MRLKGFLLTYLSHDLTQRHLFEVGGFAAHVGSSDDDKVAALGDEAIVRYRLLSSHSLQNGMTTLLDGQRVCELWTHWQTQQEKSNNQKYLDLLVFCSCYNSVSCGSMGLSKCIQIQVHYRSKHFTILLQTYIASKM